MGMSIAHGVAAGMGGIRTAGDLVARMQMTRKMRIDDAKAYVAEKLKVSPADLSDVHVMREVREELDIGIITLQKRFQPQPPFDPIITFKHLAQFFSPFPRLRLTQKTNPSEVDPENWHLEWGSQSSCA